MAEHATRTVRNEGRYDEEVRHEHDAFGKIEVTRVQSTGEALFGSALRHQHYLSVTVTRAHLTRRNSRDRIDDGGEDTIVRFSMSQDQWAQFVSSIGCGTGTPVTLERAPARGTRILGMPDLKADPVKQTFEEEVVAAGRKAVESVIAVRRRIKAFLVPGAKVPTKKELEELDALLIAAGENFPDKLGCIQAEFVEAMEQATSAAKAEFESFVGALATQTGLEALRNGAAPVLLGAADEAE